MLARTEQDSAQLQRVVSKDSQKPTKPPWGLTMGPRGWLGRPCTPPTRGSRGLPTLPCLTT
eukprot:4870537-Alexandrium_andersonii.AAC.1